MLGSMNDSASSSRPAGTALTQGAACAAPAASEPDHGADSTRRFSGVARLHGADAMARFRAAHVVVVGIGGVGSWAAEALARSAVGHLTLVDLDHIAESNTNRQIHALGDAYGRAKVQAMAERIVAINPDCRVDCIEEFVTADNAGTLLPAADLVLDCIDQVVAKAALLAWCRRQRIAAITCGAAGGRLDPTRIRSDDLARVSGDPLLAKVRYRLRREHGFPRESAGGKVRRFGLPAVFSDEPVRALRAGADTAPVSGGLACSGYGSSVTVTAPMGFAAAALALGQLAGAGRDRTHEGVDAVQRATNGAV
jgi:tRNA A37 threonylcarbamoyladenosine dehydratase